MGIAAEHLSKAELERIASEILTEPKTRGADIWAHCPFHSETTPGDAFYYTPNKDLAYCHGCGASGDIIDVYAAVQGLDNRSACRQFMEKHAPSAPNSRGGTGRPSRYKTPTAPAPALHSPSTPAEIRDPSKTWVRHATKLASTAHAALLRSDRDQQYLRSRGIDEQTIRALGLGLISRDQFRARDAWGLPAKYREDGRPKKLWVPAGILIPHYIDGCLHRIRIRRPDGEPRYYWLEGSGTRTTHIPCTASNPPGTAAVVVETELDAMAIHAVAGDLVHAIAIGSSSARPKGSALDILRASDCILYCGDFDQAGGTAWEKYWRHTFPQAEFWPVPAGKDVGDAIKDHGLDLRAWILSILPPIWSVGRFRSAKDEQGAGVISGPAVFLNEPEQTRENEEKYPASVRRLGEILQQQPIVLCHTRERIACTPKKKDRGQWVEDHRWWANNPELGRELHGLFWMDPDVAEYLNAHPGPELINRKNFWDGLSGRSGRDK